MLKDLASEDVGDLALRGDQSPRSPGDGTEAGSLPAVSCPLGSTTQSDPAKIPKPMARRFQLILIKPSHYDDEGYVIRWYRAMIPSNSLAALYGIAADCADR